MLKVNEKELVFGFPAVDEEAVLRVHFCPADSPGRRMSIETPPGAPLRLAAEGAFVTYLQPGVARRDCLYGVLRYPFAVLLSIGGTNAITGEPSMTLVRSPQNYFTAPPPGAIDGYFRDGRVYPFRAVSESVASQTRLEIRVCPMKSKALAYFRHQTKLVPGPEPSALRGITLLHGGERQCEPIYEDICNLGSWDIQHEGRAMVWVSGGS
jgi:hypothetical protein